MQFLVQKGPFEEFVDHVKKAISNRTTIPALTSIKLSATAEGLTLTGSDSDISIEGFIPAVKDGKELVSVKEPGAICLHAKYFTEMVKKLPADDIKIEVGENLATVISSNGTEFNLNGLDPEEYPKLPSVDESNGAKYKVTSKGLKEMIKKSLFAVSTSETRPILTGENWSFNDGILTCVSTDSHRLVKIPLEIDGHNKEERVITVPGNSLKELEKILFDDETEITILVTDNQILFQMEDILFYSRLLDGSYPDTSKLVPESTKTTIEVSKNKLKGAVDRALLLARDSKNNVVNIETLEGDILQITFQNAEVGKVTEKVQCHSIEGDALTISANGKYLLDTLNVLDGDDAVFRFNGQMAPFLINEKGNDKMLQLISAVRTY